MLDRRSISIRTGTVWNYFLFEETPRHIFATVYPNIAVASVQICWEDGHKICPWARDRGRTSCKIHLEFLFWWLRLMFEGRKIIGCGLRYYGVVWNPADGRCDNLMFHTSIYGSSVRSNFTVILIANEIIFNRNKFEYKRIFDMQFFLDLQKGAFPFEECGQNFVFCF